VNNEGKFAPPEQGIRTLNHSMRYFKLLVITLMLLSVTRVATGQSFSSKEELEAAANVLFSKQQYAEAKPLFSQLLSQDAMNPDYNYRFGVCIMFTESDKAKPLPYVEGGANSPGVNPEAHYFLGLLYRFNYRFDQSAEAFEKAKAKGFTGGGIDLDREIQVSRNGRVLFNDAVRFNPAMEKEVIASEFYRPYDFRKLKGKVIPTPTEFKSKFDVKNLKETYVYTPFTGTTLVYASLGEDGRNGQDLYQVKRLPNGEWSLPQRLPDVINTPFDEDFAFLDEESNVLYFSSKGHNTMGGYDVFSSKLDDATGNWSVPVNLRYPINSPFDDFLYLSDPENELAFFASTRGTAEGMVKVFKTIFHDPEKVELTVVEGYFEDETDSVFSYMETTVIDPETKEVVGKYRSNPLTGRYLLILPPKQGYAMDVAPRGAAGFQFALDVPQSGPYRPLRQDITFNKDSDKGAVELTNYFDKAGNPDTVKVVKALNADQITERMPQVSASLLAAAERESKMKAQSELAAAKKLEEEARKAEEAALAAEKARQDSIAQAELAAAKKLEEEARKAEEAALAAEKARQDSIAQAELAAAKKLEEEARKAEEAALAAEKARQDSIAQAELAAAKKLEEEARKAEEAALAAEKARQDSIAQSGTRCCEEVGRGST
jgi:hypothetical protein